MDRGTPPRRNRPAQPHPQPRPSASARGRRRAANARTAAQARALSTPTSNTSAVPQVSTTPPAATSTASASMTTSSNSSTPSTPRPNAPTTPRSRPSRPKNRQRRRAPPPLPSIAVKLIVRRLPPQLTADAFAKIADEHGAAPAVWRSFFPGAVEATGSVKRTAHVARHSVAYLAFASLDDAGKFYERFNGYVFTADATSPPGSKPPSPGASSRYVASVERSLWQGTPHARRRIPPPPQASIEQDADYLAFLNTLDETTTPPGATSASVPVASQAASSPASSSTSPSGDRDALTPVEEGRKGKGNAKSQVVTPLMEAVRSRRIERDMKKKSSKLVTRPVRVKGRQVRVIDAPKAAVDAKARRKKRRGLEVALQRKRDDNDRRGTNAKVTTPDRNVTTFAKQGAGGGASSTSSKGQTRPVGGEPSEGPESSGKHEPRSGGRSRHGRGSRSRGNKYNAPLNGVIAAGGANDHPARQDNVHGTVRLLKKEASNASKT